MLTLHCQCTLHPLLPSARAHTALQGHYNKAMSVFDSAVLSFSTTKDASTAASTKAAAIAAAREDLSKDLQHAHNTMMVQLQARVAIDQARQAVAEKQRLEQERRREQQVQQAKEAAITKYRDSMKWLMSDMEEELSATSSFEGMSRLTNTHKVSTRPQLQWMTPTSTGRHGLWSGSASCPCDAQLLSADAGSAHCMAEHIMMLPLSSDMVQHCRGCLPVSNTAGYPVSAVPGHANRPVRK